MRLLFLSDLYPPVAFGGYEMELESLVDGLRDRHEVLVVTTDLRAHEVPREPHVRRVLPSVDRGARAALAAPPATLAAVRATERAIDEHRPELVYVSSASATSQVVTAVAARRGLPLVLRLSELWYAEHLLTGDRFLRHLVPGETGARAGWGRAVRAVNRHPRLRFPRDLRLRAALSWNSQALRELAGTPEVVEPLEERVIHPVSRHAQVLADNPRMPAAEPLIAYLGRVTTSKGAKVARDAVAALRQRHGIGARLTYGGPCNDEMRAKLTAPFVDFRGQLDAQGVAQMLAQAHAVIVPSVDPEAFGLSAVEAALARAPVVASYSGGLPEALRPEEHALFFPPGDASAASAQLARTLNARKETTTRVERAFARAGEFSCEQYVQESEDLIQHTLSRWHAGG
jgi:glycosyltransferase involved in cell wall biosynthesis